MLTTGLTAKAPRGQSSQKFPKVPKSLVESTSLEPSRQCMSLLGMLHIQTIGDSVDVTEVRGLKGGVQ